MFVTRVVTKESKRLCWEQKVLIEFSLCTASAVCEYFCASVEEDMETKIRGKKDTEQL